MMYWDDSQDADARQPHRFQAERHDQAPGETPDADNTSTARGEQQDGQAPPARQAMIEAQRRLARAIVALKIAQRFGAPAADLSAAQAEYKHAEAGVYDAWEGVRASQIAPAPQSAASPGGEPASLDRLRFARWLAQSGRLNEFPERRAA